MLEVSLVADEPLIAVPVLLTASLVEGTFVSGPVTFPGAAVVVRDIVLVVGVEVWGEYVCVPAGVRATDVHVRVMAGVVVSPARPLSLTAGPLRVTLVPTKPLKFPTTGVAVEPVLTVRVLDTANLAVAALVTAVTPPDTAPTGAGKVQEVAVVSLH